MQRKTPIRLECPLSLSADGHLRTSDKPLGNPSAVKSSKENETLFLFISPAQTLLGVCVYWIVYFCEPMGWLSLRGVTQTAGPLLPGEEGGMVSCNTSSFLSVLCTFLGCYPATLPPAREIKWCQRSVTCSFPVLINCTRVGPGRKGVYPTRKDVTILWNKARQVFFSCSFLKIYFMKCNK